MWAILAKHGSQPCVGFGECSLWSFLVELFLGYFCTCVFTTAATAKSLQSCLTLCDPIDDSPPGSPVPGILQARTLEWVAISFSNAWTWKVKVKSLSRVRLLVLSKYLRRVLSRFQSFLSGFGLFSAPSCTLCSSPKSQFLLPNSGIPLDSFCVPLHVLWPENCLWAVIYVSGTTGFSCVMPIVSCGFSLLQAGRGFLSLSLCLSQKQKFLSVLWMLTERNSTGNVTTMFALCLSHSHNLMFN